MVLAIVLFLLRVDPICSSVFIRSYALFFFLASQLLLLAAVWWPPVELSSWIKMKVVGTVVLLYILSVVCQLSDQTVARLPCWVNEVLKGSNPGETDLKLSCSVAGSAIARASFQNFDGNGRPIGVVNPRRGKNVNTKA